MGLLAVEETAEQGTPSYWFFYDANGNVGQAIKASDQTIAAKYEYDPYGNVITSGGIYADDNPIRFSTKWFDTELAGSGVNGAVGESGLGYWGYRYYSPRLGRWINRDPIQELGGLNFYLFVHNSSVNETDRLGLACVGFGGSISFNFGAMFAIAPGPGFSITATEMQYVCKTPGSWWPRCIKCTSVQLSFLFTLGGTLSLSIGPTIAVGGEPSDGASIQIGGSGGVSEGGVVAEAVADWDWYDGIFSVTVPRVGIGVSFYLAGRASVSCTGCTSGADTPWKFLQRLGKILRCWWNIRAALNTAVSRLDGRPVPPTYSIEDQLPQVTVDVPPDVEEKKAR